MISAKLGERHDIKTDMPLHKLFSLVWLVYLFTE
jgi:hypothetical protein